MIPSRLQCQTLKHRQAYTLMELVVGIASSTMLMSGLAGALYISSHALDTTTAGDSTTQASLLLDSLMSDVCHAERFIEVTATGMTFEVPDRDDDGDPERILYAWGGVAGTPLYYKYNDNAAQIIVENVQHLNFTSLTRRISADTAEDNSPANVQVVGYTEKRSGSSDVSITVDTPASTSQGDLLIAIVATDGDTSASMAPSTGSWNSLLVAADDSGQATLGVWWKTADEVEVATYSFGWSEVERSYAAMIHLTGQKLSSPIDANATFQGNGALALAPSVTTSADNSLILKIGAFDKLVAVQNDAGMLGYTTIFSQSAGTGGGAISAAAAYSTQSIAGSSGSAQFTLSGIEEYRTLTIAIAPEE